MTAWRSVGSQSHTWKSDSIVVPCVVAGMRPPERIAGTRTPPVPPKEMLSMPSSRHEGGG